MFPGVGVTNCMIPSCFLRSVFYIPRPQTLPFLLNPDSCLSPLDFGPWTLGWPGTQNSRASIVCAWASVCWADYLPARNGETENRGNGERERFL